jgi:hypothetical protein
MRRFGSFATLFEGEFAMRTTKASPITRDRKRKAEPIVTPTVRWDCPVYRAINVYRVVASAMNSAARKAGAEYADYVYETAFEAASDMLYSATYDKTMPISWETANEATKLLRQPVGEAAEPALLEIMVRHIQESQREGVLNG